MEPKGATITDQLSASELEETEHLLYDYNMARTGVTDWGRIAFALRDATSAAVGVIADWTWGGCLEIRLLWLREDWRGQGWGSGSSKRQRR